MYTDSLNTFDTILPPTLRLLKKVNIAYMFYMVSTQTVQKSRDKPNKGIF